MRLLQLWAINIILLISTVVWAAIAYVFTINFLVVLKFESLEANWFGLIGSTAALFAVIQTQKSLLALRKTKEEE